MALSKLWIHCVWSTKLRIHFLTGNLRTNLFQHMLKNAEENSIQIIQIGGWIEHVHVLLKLHPSQNLSSVIHAIKGESSFWFNTENLANRKFAWQDSYYAETIGLKDIKAVRKYISNQEQHHSKYTYADEKRAMKIKN